MSTYLGTINYKNGKKKTEYRNSPAPRAFNGEPRSIFELSVVLGPYKLRALTHFRALKDQRDHAIIIHIHNDLVGACREVG